MTRSLRVGVLAVALLAPRPSLAQDFPESNAVVLKGVAAFDAQFVIATWLSLEGEQDRFKESGQAAFEAGLRAAGVEVDTSAPNYLFCVLSAAQRDDVVFYHYELDYHLYQEEGIQPLVWTGGGIATIGETDFTPAEVATDCVGRFMTEWREQNPAG